jgi:hypothetical protein
MAAVALSALLWVLLRAKGWGAAAGWTALACAGQACMLQLLDTGTNVQPQVFYGWSVLLPTWRAVILLLLGVQALLVTWGAWRHLRPGLAAARRAIPFPALLVVLAVMAYASATIAPRVAQTFVNGGFVPRLASHASKIALGMLILLVGAANLALAAATLPAEALEESKKRWRARNTSRLPWVAALWVVLVSSLLAWVVLERMPHVPDEVTYLFHAKYLAAGKLYLPMPPDEKALFINFTIADGAKWYSVVALGWPLVLAIGVWLGVPWLVGPVLGGATILLAHVLLRRLYDRELADAAALLLDRVDHVPIHGGSLRLWGKRADGSGHGASVLEMAEKEKKAGLASFSRYEEFSRRVQKNREELRALLSKLKIEGKSVAEYGAPAKGNTLLCYCGIGTDLIPYTVDLSPLKVGLLTPGSHIPVAPVQRIFDEQPAYVVVLAWNFAPEIMKFLQPIQQKGTRFILPIPEPKLL